MPNIENRLAPKLQNSGGDDLLDRIIAKAIKQYGGAAPKPPGKPEPFAPPREPVTPDPAAGPNPVTATPADLPALGATPGILQHLTPEQRAQLLAQLLAEHYGSIKKDE